MAVVATLPSSLRDRLNAVAVRIRFLRLIYGLSLLLLVLTVTGAAGLAVDYFLHLDAWVRVGLLASWVGLGLVTGLIVVVLPQFRRLDPKSLAAVVEERYPELAEKLLSAVELSGERGLHHGSPALIDLLLADTTSQTQRLSFTRAVPAGLVAGLAVAALVLLGGLLSPATIWPRQYSHLAARFFAPWHTPPVLLDYAVESPQGDVVAARGRPFVLTARLVPLVEAALLPGDCTLVLTHADGQSERHPMKPGQDEGLFAFELRSVADTVSYHVESGLAKSDLFTLTAVDPVALAPNSPTLKVTPPEYAKATQPETTQTGLVNVTALQHSQVSIEAKFTQPARQAFLVLESEAESHPEAVNAEVHPVLTKLGARAGAVAGMAAGRNNFRLSLTGFEPDRPSARESRTEVEKRPMTLADDGLSATAEITADAGTQFRLLLVGDHDIETVLGPLSVTVRVDQPPAFHKVSLSDQLKAVLPHDRVPLEFTVVDDVGVAGALVEYQVNDDKVAAEVIPLSGANKLEATAKHAFALSGKVKEGDTLRLRLKAMDNRRLPNKGPQEVYHPSQDGWLTLKVASEAKPLQEQEIQAQRDDVNKKLDKIKDDLRAEQRLVYKLQKEAKDDKTLSPENAQLLKDLKQDNRATEDDLRDLARDAAKTPELQQIADAAQDVADQEMRKSGDDLRQAEKGDAKARDEKLKKADAELDKALQKIDAMRKANDQIAQQRLDQMKLDLAAQKQQDLADRTADLAKDPMKDADAAKEAKDLQKEQGNLAKELDKLAEQSDALKNAFDGARAEQAKELADKARELAKEQKDLAEQGKQDDPQRQQQMADLAKKQQELAEKAAKLAKETQQAARAAQTTPFKPDEAQKAADNLKNNDAGEAVKNQDQTARDLDKLAEELDRAIDLAKDPREAASQLARMQQSLKQKLADELANKTDKKPLGERIADVLKQQEALRKAIENLDVPDANNTAQTDRRNAMDQAAQAAQALKANPRTAALEMEQSRQALEQLAKDLPSLDQRNKAARDEVARLRQQQESVDQLTQQAFDPKTKKPVPEKLTEAMRKQADMAERLSELDAPGHEERQQKAAQTLNQALKDLMDGRPQDVPASQQAAKRALDRLEQELAGKTPADAQAQKLADDQQQLLEEAKKLTEKAPPQQLAELLKKQQELAQKTKDLPAPEAPQRQAEAADATRQAADNKPKSVEDLLKKMDDASKALDKLAEQMNGQESDAAKADRLAKKQAEAAAEAQRQKPPTPEAQRQMAQELKETRGGDEAQAEKEKALEALKKAQQAMPQDQPQAQKQAAEAMKDFADKLSGKKQAAEKPADPPKEQQALKPNDSPKQSARQLAEKQKDLIKQTQKARDDAGWFPDAKAQKKYEDALGKIEEQQKQLNKQASQLPADGQQRALEQTRETMNQAEQLLDRKEGMSAQAKQREAANMLDRLAQGLPDKRPEPAAQNQPQNQGPLNQQQSQQARDLAQQQRELRDQAQKMAQQKPANQDQQQAQQQNLEKKADGLMEQLKKLSEQMNRSPQAQQSTQQAQQETRQAKEQMQQSREQGQQGNQGRQQQAMQEAMKALERAAKQSQQAGEKMQPQQQAGQEAGQDVQQAQQQMRKAQQELNQGQPQPAQTAMQKAADALKQAAEKFMKPNPQAAKPQPTPSENPMGIPPSGEGRVDGSLLAPDMKQYAGKRWGELPGELQTRIIQDMKARYGDDYARIIKLYFEQLADTKKK